jgi:hypothetical protein
MPYLGPDKQWTLYFDDGELDADRLIGGEEGGLAPVFDGLNPERIVIAALGNGMARLALEKASAYARERNVWGAPIGTHQGIAHPLAKAKIELGLGRLMTQKAAALLDAGSPGAGEASNIAEYAAAEAAKHCVDRAIQTHGGNGLTLEYGISDMWLPVRLMDVAPVSAEMILNYIAQHSLGRVRTDRRRRCWSRSNSRALLARPWSAASNRTRIRTRLACCPKYEAAKSRLEAGFDLEEHTIRRHELTGGSMHTRASRKSSIRAGFGARNGETRTRTGDTTVFRQMLRAIEPAAKCLQACGFLRAHRGPRCRANSA